METKHPLHMLADEVGAIIAEKNKAYGNSFEVANEILRIHYPTGIPVEQIPNALLLVRIFDKTLRIATANDTLGESPFFDIAGYALCGLSLQKKTAPPPFPPTPPDQKF